jgi:hypothetical protein
MSSQAIGLGAIGLMLCGCVCILVIVSIVFLVKHSRSSSGGGGGVGGGGCANVPKFDTVKDLVLVGKVLKTMPSGSLPACQCACDQMKNCTHVEVQGNTCVLKDATTMPDECSKVNAKCADYYPVANQDVATTGYYHPNRGMTPWATSVQKQLYKSYQESNCSSAKCIATTVLGLLSNVFAPFGGLGASILARVGTMALNATGHLADLGTMGIITESQALEHRLAKQQQAQPYVNISSSVFNAMQNCTNDGTLTIQGPTRPCCKTCSSGSGTCCDQNRSNDCKTAQSYAGLPGGKYNYGGQAMKYLTGFTNCTSGSGRKSSDPPPPNLAVNGKLDCHVTSWNKGQCCDKVGQVSYSSNGAPSNPFDMMKKCFDAYPQCGSPTGCYATAA